MAEIPEGLTQKQIDRYAYLDQGIKKLQDEHKQLNDLIKRAHEDKKGTFAYPSEKFGSVIVTIGQQNRTDAKALEEAHSFEKFPQFWSMQFDVTAVPDAIKNKFKNAIKTLSIKVAE